MTGRAWHDGASAEAAGDGRRRARSGGVAAAASIRRWRAGGGTSGTTGIGATPPSRALRCALATTRLT
ncbi:hypothetical protein FEP36_05834 [Burkholderia multivorans]|nr:hypothetical protein [Burkholderia multivorans]